MTWLWLACAPAWTAAEALAPHLARLDTDHDGRVVAAEYERTVWNGAPFGSVDADADGALSPGELATLVATQDAVGFDHPAVAVPSQRATEAVLPLPTDSRDVWELLVAMGDALRAAGEPGPDPAMVAAAVHSGRLDSEASRAVLAKLRPRWVARGWAWPEGVP
ncbi:MAG: hypothetical protein EXR71_02765 [Myxococcales bacterium]|nr:hypothetical protein [Myxococcales bacterium]